MNDERYREQHMLRLAYMPWLYDRLKSHQREWATQWQAEIQQTLMELESIEIGENVFIAPQARLFAEPGRTIVIGDGARIAADCVLHGPLTIGAHVSINHHVTMDGGRAGIRIGDHSRIAAYATLYAFNHGMDACQLVREQPVSSRGISIGADVWIGAQAGVVDGVQIGDGAVVGMNAQVVHDVEPYAIVAGNPARAVGRRT